MNQVNVSINGRNYLLNCGAGEEERLMAVASYLNEKVGDLDKITKQSGDTNLMLAAALLASSDVLELRARIASTEKELETSRRAEQDMTQLATKNDASAQEALTQMAQRMESLTAMIEAQVADMENPSAAAPEPAAAPAPAPVIQVRSA